MTIFSFNTRFLCSSR